jgi:hypothetical protein
MEDDWRLSEEDSKENFLFGKPLCWKKYKRYSEKWDHDHCSFCWEKFTEPDYIPEALHQGYTTLDDYYWICESCFNDFKERFAWTLIKCEG